MIAHAYTNVYFIFSPFINNYHKVDSIFAICSTPAFSPFTDGDRPTPTHTGQVQFRRWAWSFFGHRMVNHAMQNAGKRKTNGWKLKRKQHFQVRKILSSSWAFPWLQFSGVFSVQSACHWCQGFPKKSDRRFWGSTLGAWDLGYKFVWMNFGCWKSDLVVCFNRPDNQAWSELENGSMRVRWCRMRVLQWCNSHNVFRVF